MSKQNNSGADTLRSLVNWLNNTNESALDDYSAEELIKLYQAFEACEWDFTLCQWTARQRWEALNENKVPQWDGDERPCYGTQRF